jgi:glycosyltransferase involved in cell wall biosynthesis
MKLLLIITDYGSFNNFLFELAEKITTEAKIELHIVCSRLKVIDISNKKSLNNYFNIHFVDIPRKISIGSELKAAREIRRIVDLVQPDLIHSHFTTATFPTLLLKRSKISYWATFHGLGMNSSSGLKRIMFTVVELYCLYRLDRIFTLNNQDTDFLKDRFSSRVKKYDCFGVGCDTNKFDRCNISQHVKSQLRNKHQIKGHHFVITFTGRFVHFKGFDLVIKSFRELVENNPDQFKLILLGGSDSTHANGLSQPDAYFFANSADVINIGFTDQVELYLSITDAFLFPSKKEGLPTAILESLAMGVPVITFNARGNNDIVRHMYNGLLLDIHEGDQAKEVAAIIDAVCWLRINPEKAGELTGNAIKDRAAYSRDCFVNEQLSYYNNFKNESHVQELKINHVK